ncbi:MAG TPA: DUF4097 family beta strand repeat-containing protein [Pyrinomonadaceae bacterium]|jgi:hypothetical protein
MKHSLKTLLFALALALAPQAAAQGPGAGARGEGASAERRAEADPRVVVTLCLSQGDVLVRGWDRREVSARAVGAGTLRLLTPNVTPAPRVEVLASDEADAEPGAGDCGSVERVELMTPRGATVNIQSHNGHVEVSDVAELRVKSLSGDVNARRVSQSVEVSCLSGDVSVADSSGPVRVATISGHVEARNVRTLSAADNFEAKSTSGDVTLEGVGHGQVVGSAVSGSVLYTGALARGGSYDFRTISGDVTLELPANSSFNLHARVVVSGEINTDFPVRLPPGGTTAVPATPGAPTPAATPGPAPEAGPLVVVVTPENGRPKQIKVKPPKEVREPPTSARLDGTVGGGGAVVNLSSFSGSLHLKKR